VIKAPPTLFSQVFQLTNLGWLNILVYAKDYWVMDWRGCSCGRWDSWFWICIRGFILNNENRVAKAAPHYQSIKALEEEKR